VEQVAYTLSNYISYEVPTANTPREGFSNDLSVMMEADIFRSEWSLSTSRSICLNIDTLKNVTEESDIKSENCKNSTYLPTYLTN